MDKLIPSANDLLSVVLGHLKGRKRERKETRKRSIDTLFENIFGLT